MPPSPPPPVQLGLSFFLCKLISYEAVFYSFCLHQIISQQTCIYIISLTRSQLSTTNHRVKGRYQADRCTLSNTNNNIYKAIHTSVSIWNSYLLSCFKNSIKCFCFFIPVHIFCNEKNTKFIVVRVILKFYCSASTVTKIVKAHIVKDFVCTCCWLCFRYQNGRYR